MMSLQDIVLLFGYFELWDVFLDGRFGMDSLENALTGVIDMGMPEGSARTGLSLPLESDIFELLNGKMFVLLDNVCIFTHYKTIIIQKNLPSHISNTFIGNLLLYYASLGSLLLNMRCRSSSLLSHQIVKLILRNPSVMIEIRPLDHLLQKEIIRQLSQLLGYLSQLLHCDIP